MVPNLVSLLDTADTAEWCGDAGCGKCTALAIGSRYQEIDATARETLVQELIELDVSLVTKFTHWRDVMWFISRTLNQTESQQIIDRWGERTKQGDRQLIPIFELLLQCTPGSPGLPFPYDALQRERRQIDSLRTELSISKAAQDRLRAEIARHERRLAKQKVHLHRVIMQMRRNKERAEVHGMLGVLSPGERLVSIATDKRYPIFWFSTEFARIDDATLDLLSSDARRLVLQRLSTVRKGA